MNRYQWINTREIVGFHKKRVILFGAGKGSEELLQYILECKLNVSVLAIADNDESFHGKNLLGHKIIAPGDIHGYSFDLIVVTSVSGRDSIAAQLEEMGYRFPSDYMLVGRYPGEYKDKFQNYMSTMRNMDESFSLKDTNCLHIGPGGFLGLEILLYCFGADKIVSIDKYPFAIRYPDLTPCFDEYIKIKESVSSLKKTDEDGYDPLQRFEEVLLKKNNRLFLDPNRIQYIFPMDVCDLTFEDNLFDLVLSFAVLEHVRDPRAAITNTANVLKPGGFGFHTIITRDHRSFSNVQGYHPFSFRSRSKKEWENMNKHKFYQNRLLPVEWKNEFLDSGLEIVAYFTNEIMIDDQIISRFHHDFNQFSIPELSEVDCTIVTKKSK